MKLDTILYDLPECEIDSRGSEVGQIVANAGYSDTPRGLINKWKCWSITLAEFLQMVNPEYKDE